jgi:DNA-directed RNA polymerase subunit RPC12/RpoP
VSWLWPEHVNRNLPLTKPERKQIHRDAWRLWFANRWNLVLYLSLIAVYALTVLYVPDGAGCLATLFGLGLTGHRLFRLTASVGHAVLLFVVGGVVLQRYRFAPCVHRATRLHGYDVCAKCGYWLEGLGEDGKRCPECGTARTALPGSSAPSDPAGADQSSRGVACPNCHSAEDHQLVWDLRNLGAALLNALNFYVLFGFWPFVSLKRAMTPPRPLRRQCLKCGYKFAGQRPELPNFDECARCSYSLKGNRSGRCPECGWKLPRRYRAYRRLVDRDMPDTRA